jgi:ferric-dicitrate binding protein FerR (iron transport regulator)
MDEQKPISEKEETLLRKYVSGTISESEIRELQQLAGTSSALKQSLQESDHIIDQLDALNRMKKVDTPAAFTKFATRISKYPVKKSWLYYWQRVAAVLLLPLLVFSLLQYYSKDASLPTDTAARLEYNEIKTSPGLRSTFNLPDGTKVWLNGNTKIRYPIAFFGDVRMIHLEGEAYFEVSKNKEKPFIVDMGRLQVQAIGTAFNCMAYPGEDRIETALSEGKVKVTRFVKGESKGEYVLNPGQVISYQNSSGQFQLHKDNLDKYLAWRSGKFIFRNDPMEVVCQKLGRWFNAEIIIKDESLKGYSFTGTFQEEGLSEILDLISLTSPVRFKLYERSINERNEYGPTKVEIMKR